MSKTQNDLEDYSNFSALLIIFVGNLYVTKLDSLAKDMLIILMMVSCSLFTSIWIISTFDIFFMSHLNFFRNKLFRFFVFYLSMKKVFLNKKSHQINLWRYLLNINKEFRAYKDEIKKETSEIMSFDEGGINKFQKAKTKKKMFKDFFKFLGDI